MIRSLVTLLPVLTPLPTGHATDTCPSLILDQPSLEGGMGCSLSFVPLGLVSSSFFPIPLIPQRSNAVLSLVFHL